MNNTHHYTLSQFLIRTYYIFLAALLLLFFFSIAISSSVSSLLFFGGEAVLFWLYKKYLSVKIDSFPDSSFILLCCFVLLIGCAAMVLLPVSMNSYFPSDTQIIYDAAAYLSKHRDLSGVYDSFGGYATLGFERFSDYFCRYYNNILMLLTVTAIYKVFGWTGFKIGTASGQVLAIAVTSIFMVIGIIFFLKAITLITKSKSNILLGILLTFSFLAPYYSCPNVYTDIWVIPFMLIACFHWVAYCKEGTSLNLVVCAVLLGIGALYKITALIQVVAIVIYSLLNNNWGLKRKIIVILAFVFIILLIFSLFKLWYRSSPIFDFSRERDLYYPWTLWLCFGSHANGMYNRQDCELAYSTPYEQRDAIVWNEIKKNYSSYSFKSYISFIANKWSLTWSDGLFDGGYYTQYPISDEWSWTLRLTQPSFRTYWLLRYFSNGYILFLFFLLLCKTLIHIKNKDKSISIFFLLSLLILGFIIYLSFFESAPRRAIPAIFAAIGAAVLSSSTTSKINC